jgi:mRNA-degrading endonuclease RelE of RelBE toxin-antitoxin system
MAERPVELAPRAMRDLRRLAAQDAERLLDDLQILKQAPWPGPPKVKKLRGQDLFRLRTGDYRWVFESREGKVVVLRIVDRREFDRVLKAV